MAFVGLTVKGQKGCAGRLVTPVAHVEASPYLDVNGPLTRALIPAPPENIKFSSWSGSPVGRDPVGATGLGHRLSRLVPPPAVPPSQAVRRQAPGLLTESNSQP